MKRNHLLNAKVQQVDHLHVLGSGPVVRHAQSQAGRIEAQVETLQAHRECGIEWCSNTHSVTYSRETSPLLNR